MTEKNQSSFRLIQQVFTEAKPSMQLIMLILLMVIFAIIGSFIAMLVSVPLYGLSWEQIQSHLDTGFRDADPGLIRFFQSVQTITVFIIPAIIANSLVLNKESRFSAEKFNVRTMIAAGLVLFTFLAAMPSLNLLIRLNESMHFPDSWKEMEEKLISLEEERNFITERLLSEKTGRSFFLNLLAVAILPAIGEEFFFRGMVQQILNRWFRNIHVAVLLTAALFSAIHLQFFGFIPRFLLGAFFGYLFVWARNIWLPVMAHMLNNTLAISLMFIAEGRLLNSAWFGEGGFPRLSLLIFSILLTGFGIWRIHYLLTGKKNYSDTSI